MNKDDSSTPSEEGSKYSNESEERKPKRDEREREIEWGEHSDEDSDEEDMSNEELEGKLEELITSEPLSARSDWSSEISVTESEQVKLHPINFRTTEENNWKLT